MLLVSFFFDFKVAGGSFPSASSVLPEGNCSAYSSLQTLFPWVMQIVCAMSIHIKPSRNLLMRLLWVVAGSNLLHRQMLMLACSREELWIITNHLNSRKDNKVAYNMPSAVAVTMMVAALGMKIRLMGMQPQSAVWQIMPRLLIFTKIPSSQCSSQFQKKQEKPFGPESNSAKYYLVCQYLNCHVGCMVAAHQWRFRS
jgi:hypothetical protein